MNTTINLPIFRWTFGILAVLLPALCAVAADAPAAHGGKKVRIVLAGDSTVTDKAGWGTGFAKCLTDDVELINLSRGGRSSKSFIAEGSWKKVLELKPDYVLIQFGHNDQPGHGPDRETDPQTTYRQYMTQYVDEARAAGIKPVLVTSLSRRQWGADGKIHSTLQPNADVVKQIAVEKKVPLIDLHARSIELYEKLGKEAVNKLSPKKTPKGDKAEQGSTADALDGTHLNAKGSDVVGPIVAEELKKVVPELAAYIK
jgi:lysophospholipase L1-like esterase